MVVQIKEETRLAVHDGGTEMDIACGCNLRTIVPHAYLF